MPGHDAPITTLRHAVRAGQPGAADALVAQLYHELRALARSRLRRSGQFTLLDTTALVHEGFLRLQGRQGGDGGQGAADAPVFADRQHFFCLCSARHAQRGG